MISYPRQSGIFATASSIAAGQERWRMYFSLFLDESGKIHQGRYTSFCGFVATQDDWAQFGNIWTRTQMRWNVPVIHMSRIMAASSSKKDDEWERIRTRMGNEWHSFRETVLLEFAALVRDMTPGAVGSVIDGAAYRAIKEADPDDYLISHADCNVYLFQHALMKALDAVELVDKSGLLTVGIDDDQEDAFEYYKSYWNLQTLITNPSIPPELKHRFERIPLRVDQIAFCKDTFHPAVQAADMLAYTSRKLKIENERPRGDEETLVNKMYGFLTRAGTYPIQDLMEPQLRVIAGNTAKSVRIAKDEQNCPDGI